MDIDHETGRPVRGRRRDARRMRAAAPGLGDFTGGGWGGASGAFDPNAIPPGVTMVGRHGEYSIWSDGSVRLEATGALRYPPGTPESVSIMDSVRESLAESAGTAREILSASGKWVAVGVVVFILFEVWRESERAR